MPGGSWEAASCPRQPPAHGSGPSRDLECSSATLPPPNHPPTTPSLFHHPPPHPTRSQAEPDHAGRQERHRVQRDGPVGGRVAHDPQLDARGRAEELDGAGARALGASGDSHPHQSRPPAQCPAPTQTPFAPPPAPQRPPRLSPPQHTIHAVPPQHRRLPRRPRPPPLSADHAVGDQQLQPQPRPAGAGWRQDCAQLEVSGATPGPGEGGRGLGWAGVGGHRGAGMLQWEFIAGVASRETEAPIQIRTWACRACA